MTDIELIAALTGALRSAVRVAEAEHGKQFDCVSYGDVEFHVGKARALIATAEARGQTVTPDELDVQTFRFRFNTK